MDASKGGLVDKKYCTECWMQYPQRYLQTTTKWDGNKGGLSNCQVQCDSGFTSDGNKDKICDNCNEVCKTCVDNGRKGDKDKCIECSEEFPYMYSATSTCMKECGVGFW